ncbi:MAG TPA: phosphotransferase family protein [Acidimicrobiia bacterium]|jgi:aminoglycoside phosphotransferase (APT) family kinase protein
MGSGDADPLRLPDDVLDWIAEETGGEVAAANRVPGGASREAWFVDVLEPDGTTRELFLRYSRRPTPPGGAFLDLRTEAAIFAALQDTDVTVPRMLGVHPVHEAMLAERAPGQTWFRLIRDPDEQVQVAQDFIRNLAALHRLDPSTLPLPERLLPVRTNREHALAEIVEMRRRATDERGMIEPLVRIALDWLERNVPDDDAPVVLVQGDTGPGNFLYHEGRVTAVLDWELAHLGDPMDDIAWLSLRTVQDTFTHFPDRLHEYEQLSGHHVDPERVWYYRLFAETRLATARPAADDDDTEAGGREGDAQPVAGDIGNGLIYGMLHRRLTMEALVHVTGIEPTRLDVSRECEAESTEWHQQYDRVLGSLQVIVPRIADPLANQWAKGVARMVKYLQEADRYGRPFDRAELADIAALLGHRPASLDEGRRLLADAANGGHVTDDDYLRYAWRRLQRDDFLLRNASGALATRTWPPIR